MFTREAGAVGRLSDHPGVVTAYDAGLLPDSRPYVIMELCPGGSLTQWINPEHLRSEDQIRWIGMRVADALAAVHARGLLHRDVKPANILIDSFGSPRLADFGLAAVAGAESSASDVLKLTPAYAPPEALARSAATESGDVYSLAATLYALLSGGPPVARPTGGGSQTAAGAAEEPITPIPGVNWFLMDVLMAALSSDPASRPSAADLRDQLSGCLSLGRGSPSPAMLRPRDGLRRSPSPGSHPAVTLGTRPPRFSPTQGRRQVRREAMTIGKPTHRDDEHHAASASSRWPRCSSPWPRRVRHGSSPSRHHRALPSLSRAAQNQSRSPRVRSSSRRVPRRRPPLRPRPARRSQRSTMPPTRRHRRFG